MLSLLFIAIIAFGLIGAAYAGKPARMASAAFYGLLSLGCCVWLLVAIINGASSY